MSACSHHCAVSFAAADKYTYVFGDLQILPETSAAVLDGRQRYAFVSNDNAHADRSSLTHCKVRTIFLQSF